MKPRDIGLALVLAAISGVLTYAVSSATILSKKATRSKVDVVEPISKDFNFSGKPYFRADSIDPTRDITIEPTGNNQPLK